jgi:NitT/TauT family transport system substrate-binding protein
MILSRRATLYAALGGGALALPAISRAHAADPVRIRIGNTPLVEFVSAYMAIDRGYFAARGLDVSIVPITINSTIPAAIAAGSIEIGALNAAVFLQAVDGGLDQVVISSASDTIPGRTPFAYITRPDVPYTGPQSIAGKRILVPGVRSSLDVLFRRWLRSHGVDPGSVIEVEMPSVQIANALKSHAADGAQVIEPYLTRIVDEKIAIVGARYADELPGPIQGTMYIADRGWVEKNPTAVAAFRAGLAEGVKAALGDPAATQQVLQHYIKLPPEVLATMPFPALDLTITPEKMQFWISAMDAEGMLTTKIDAARIVYPGA